MHEWHCHSVQDGYVLELVAVPRWAADVARVADWVDGRTGHILCAERLPERAWRICVGQPVFAPEDLVDGEVMEDAFPVNSLGSRLYDFFGRVLFLDASHARPLSRFSVPAEAAAALVAAYTADDV